MPISLFVTSDRNVTIFLQDSSPIIKLISNAIILISVHHTVVLTYIVRKLTLTNCKMYNIMLCISIIFTARANQLFFIILK